MNFAIFLFILKITSIILLPSDDMWNQAVKSIDERLIYNFNKTHFIFEEKNFTSLGIDDKKMKALYNKQDKIYKQCGITSYIFAVSKINETIETLDSIRTNTRDNLRKNGYDVDNSIFSVFSIDPISGLIYTGSNTRAKYISNDDAKLMKEKIINNFEKKNYYNAWDDFFDDIIYFCNNKTENKTSISENTTYYTEKTKDSKSKTSEYLGIIGGVAAIIGIIILMLAKLILK